MNALELLQYMVGEEHKMIDKLLEKLDSEKLDISLGGDETIRSRLKHMCGAEFRMAGYLVPLDNDEFEVDFSTVNSIKNAFDISMNRHLMTLSKLTTDDLNKMWVSPRSGDKYEYRWLLYHFIEHLSTHRGQIAMALRQS